MPFAHNNNQGGTAEIARHHPRTDAGRFPVLSIVDTGRDSADSAKDFRAVLHDEERARTRPRL